MSKKINRNKLRKMIIAEAKNMISEMGMGGAPHPDSPEYETTAQVIQNCIMSCIHAGRCDPMRVQMMTQEMCEDYGCPQYADYCAQRVISACQRMGL